MYDSFSIPQLSLTETVKPWLLKSLRDESSEYVILFGMKYGPATHPDILSPKAKNIAVPIIRPTMKASGMVISLLTSLSLPQVYLFLMKNTF